MKIKEKVKKIIYPILYFYPRRMLKNKEFTIISDNCWGGKVYQELGRPYNTPFIGLFIFSPDYIKLLQNLEYYLKGNYSLVFMKTSRYISDFDNSYPIALLDDIEIHFLHYKSEEEALSKWERRLKRMNWENIFFKFNDNDECNYELMKSFQELNYKGKVIFSAINYPDLPDLVFFKSKSHEGKVGIDLKIYHRYFDVFKWLKQGGTNFMD